jgi:UDPglucose 6-dehydrogenase
MLSEGGAKVRAYDPVGMDRARAVMPNVEMVSDPYALAERCQALVVCTEWNEFKQLDLEHLCEIMPNPVIVDGRNIYDPKVMGSLGIRYFGMGRGYTPDGQPIQRTAE